MYLAVLEHLCFVNLVDRKISTEELREAVNELKRNILGLDLFTAECVKKGSMAVLQWLARLLT